MTLPTAILSSYEALADKLPPEQVPDTLVRRIESIRFALSHNMGVPQAHALLSYEEYLGVRVYYENEITRITTEYLSNDRARTTSYKGQMKRAMIEAFGPAYEIGWKDGSEGGDYWQDSSDEDKAWYNAKQNTELANIDQLFERLKDLKSEGVEAWQGIPEQRAIGYSKTLDGVYNEGRIRAAKNKMLTFGGDDGEESCKTCKRMKGQRHRASWWKKRGLIPGQPGNDAFECGGWNCRHYLFDDQGNLFTF